MAENKLFAYKYKLYSIIKFYYLLKFQNMTGNEIFSYFYNSSIPNYMLSLCTCEYSKKRERFIVNF